MEYKEDRECNDFNLPPEGISADKRNKIFMNQLEFFKEQKKNFLGYQVNQCINHEEIIKQFFNLHINNVGDPFEKGNMTINSKPMEQAVLDYYAKLLNATTPYDPNNGESYWGYTLSMGSTQGNFSAIFNARDYLGGKVLLKYEEDKRVIKLNSRNSKCTRLTENLVCYQAEIPKNNRNAYTPVAFYSQDTHYSIFKATRVLNFQTFYELGSANYECPLNYPDDYPDGFSQNHLGENNWPIKVPSNRDGSINIPILVKLVEFFVKKGHPIYICFNYGTTFKGAYDNVQEAVNALVPILKENNMYEREITYIQNNEIKKIKRNGFWFHVDGALGVAYMPLIEKAIEKGLITLPENYKFPYFDFRIPEIHSIVMSIYKWIGSPISFGLFMTKIKHQISIPRDPMYIGSPETAFSGSRNGLAPIILWNFLAKHSEEEQIRMALHTEMLAQYAESKLKELQQKSNIDLWVERSPLALTIRFRKPNKSIIFKYSLSCETTYVNDEQRSYAHIFTMGHVSQDLIDRLVNDLNKPDAFVESLEG